MRFTFSHRRLVSRGDGRVRLRPPKTIPAPPDVKAPPADAVKTASGLASKVIKPGTGKTHPGETDLVTVHYTGWTTDGKMFDSSRRAGEPATFPLNRVIAGWTEGVQLMVTGETRRFWIPEALAYQGKRDPQGHARVRRRADLVQRVAAPGAARRQGAAGRREEDAERPRLQGASRRAPAREHPSARSQVTVHYTGWTTDGKMFDSSVTRGEPATFPLDGVIAGWTEGVQLMVEGEKTRFWIPEKLAYKGKQPPFGMLVFDVELLEDPVESGRGSAGSVEQTGSTARPSRPGLPARPARPARLAGRCLVARPGLRRARVMRRHARWKRSASARRVGSGTRPMRDQAGLRLTHLFGRGAPAAVVVDLAADRVRGQRFLQHRGEPGRRRQRGVVGRGRGPASDAARSSTRSHERFHPLAVGVGIEIGARERRRPAGDDARERGGEALVERARAVGIDAARGNLLLPASAQRANGREQVCGRLGAPHRLRGGERFELGADRFARRDALGARDVVTLRVAREEAIARAAEPLPDRFGPALLDRTDRLPLGLQLS